MATQLRTWVRDHPLQALLRGGWLLLHFALGGLLGGLLAWGPLDGGTLLVIALGTAAGLLSAGLWAHQQRAACRGDVTTARNWRRGLLFGNLAIVLVLAAAALPVLYRLGTFPPIGESRVETFDRLLNALEASYAYADLKAVDWDRFRDRYRPLVTTFESETEFLQTLSLLLADLNDAHTHLSPDALLTRGCSFAQMREIDGHAVVVVVGRLAYESGLTVGSVLRSVNGRPWEQAIEAVDPRLRYGSTPWQRRQDAVNHLLHTPLGETVDVLFETPAGAQESVTLACEEEPVPGPVDQVPDIWSHLYPIFTGELVAERLDSGLGYIRIPSFGGDVADRFDAALDELVDTPGLILDLRGNGGGSTFVSDPIAGRFLAEPFVYGREVYRARLPQRFWRSHIDYTVRPRSPIYTGPVVLLIDGWVMSTAENFVVALVDSGRVQTVGRRTGGASGNPIHFKLGNGFSARFSTGAFRRIDGTPIEGVGITPDVPVQWTLEDVRQGGDPDLAAAEALLLDGSR